MKTYMAITAVSMISLVGLAVASIPFEGHRMAQDRAVQEQVQASPARAGENIWADDDSSL